MENLKYINIPEFVNNNGKTSDIKLSYQLFGRPLHTAPIILVNHALTGNSNVVGDQGWWNDLIGDNKCIDTLHYTILAFNVPGNGYDNLEENLIHNYQEFTARNIAEIFALGLQHLLINKLYAIIGGSVGGGIAWELAVLKPNLAQHVIPIATDWKVTDWITANCHIQDAILNNSNQPLKDARMHAMTLYRTPESLTKKFSRSKNSQSLFKVQSWLSYHGDQLDSRFHLSAYKLMNQILKTIDITKGRLPFKDVASVIKGQVHIITINSDLFFKADENWETYIDLKSVKQNVTIGEIKSLHGHDAFLIEFDQLSSLLNPIFKSKEVLTNKFETVLKKCV
jgi:homoserine O-acetyltransferase